MSVGSRRRTTPLERSLTIIIAAGCVISLLTFGLRSAFGLFTAPLSASLGWSRETYAVAMALQNLFWGVGQPLAGAMVDRYGPARVLAVGGILYAVGLALMSVSTSPLTLHLTGGFLVGFGMGGASYITVLGALGRIVPEEHRSWALGMATAAASLGQFLIVPLGQAFISAYGWQTAALLLAGLAAASPFLASMFAGASRPSAGGLEPELSFRDAIRQAFGHGSYLLLVAGFFVCGFQLAFITVHMPPYLADVGVSASLAAWAIAFVGLFNIGGAYMAGVLGARRSKKNLLSVIYFGRAVVTVLFIALPVSSLTVLGFGAAMGILWLSTAPLTSGLVAVMFGTRYMATLFGLVFFSHQLGSFTGVWLGGVLFEHTGSYDLAWWLTVILAVGAGLVHLPIAERPAPRTAVTAGY